MPVPRSNAFPLGLAMFSYSCPFCSQRLLAPTEKAGTKTICPKCLKPLTVPAHDRMAAVDLESAIDILAGSHRSSEHPDQRGFAWSYFRRFCGRQLTVSERIRANVSALAVSTDGRMVAVGDVERNIFVWNRESGKLRPMAGKHDGATFAAQPHLI